jgi:O-antigen/teichoic acid export membrane protein
VRGPGRSTVGASGAVVAEGTAAATSMAIQVAAARNLGAARYGSFTILLGTIVLLVALHGGWVGDSRTVLDRTVPALRGALRATSLALAVGGGALAALGALALGVVDGTGAALFFVVCVLWVVEDAGRRLFMARLEFWKGVVNDVVYGVVALGSLAAIAASPGRLDLDGFLVAMALGAAAAVVAARIQLPSEEWAGGPLTAAGLREVAGFGAWRAAHAGIRPLATVVLRTLVRALASAAALGRLEAARLALAPMLIVTSGVGSFLLPHYARRRGGGSGGEPLVRPAAALALLVLAYTAVATALTPPLSGLLTGHEGALDRVSVAGWGLFATAFAVGIPAGTWVLARGRSAVVFRLRALDSGVGLLLAVPLVAVSARLAPYGLAAGAAVGAVLLWVRARAEPQAVVAA